MEFYHLRSFIVVAETKNLTQAAKRLCSTPPAISAHIKALEDELATKLFTRSSKGMALTEKGELLRIKAQETLDSAVDMVNLAADNQSEIIGNFCLALNQDIKSLKLSLLADNIKENCDGISLEVIQASTEKIITGVENKEIDGGYIYGDVPDDCFAVEVKSQKITTIAPLDFELNLQQVVLASDLKQATWITMSRYCPFDQLLFSMLGSDIKSVVKSADNATRLELVKSGYGLSFLELELAKINAEKHHVQIVDLLDFTTPLHFIVAKKRINEPVIKAILQEIRILWGINV